MRPLKVFVSSPMDVNSERSVVRRVVERLSIEYAYHFRIELVLSELEPILATQTPQASIMPPSSTDIVVVLLWSRMGTPLPKDPRFTIDGDARQPTGTEWEFFDAFRANKKQGRPDLLVYRKTEKVTADLADENHVLESLSQKRELDRFLNTWFRSSDGSWKAWFHSFEREEDLEHLIDSHLRKLIEAKVAADPRTDDPPSGKLIEGNPYRGLRSFEPEDAPLFFGRTSALNELKEVIETQNALRRGFVIVTGGSGSGKSSLIKAGLLADLKNPYRVGRVAHCRHVITRPTDHGGQLMMSIGHALLSNSAFPELRAVGWTAEELANVALQDPQRIIESLRHSAGVVARAERLRDASEIRLCLIIDQLEELFTAGIPRPDVNAFTRLMTCLARSELVWVISTLRSDFYHRLDDLPELLLLAERAIYRLKPPTPTELGQMIRKPAQLAGLRFQNHPETGISLDAILQDDAVSDPTALPLLEFALTELWNQRSPDGLLTFEAYERMGRMTGAIAERAESLIAQMSTATQKHIPSTLRALVTVSDTESEPTAATVNRSQIATTLERTEILDSLIAARLVVTDDLEKRGDPRCRLAHEKLLETWPRLRKLALGDREFLEVRQRLRMAAEAWAGHHRIGDLLLPRGSRLSEGESALISRRDDLDSLTAEFVEASIKAEHDERYLKLRNSRRIAAGFAGLAFVAVAMLGLTLWKESEIVRSAERANRGFGIAMQAAATLSRTAGAGGSNIEEVLTTADRLVEETVKANSSAPDDVLVQRGVLLLSFAATSERLGDYDNQFARISLARRTLDQLCPDTSSRNVECRIALADTYVSEGDHFWRIGKFSDAIQAYELGLKHQLSFPSGAVDNLKLSVTDARTLSLLSRAQTSSNLYDEAFKTANRCQETVRPAIDKPNPTYEARLVDASCHLRAAQAAVKSEDTEGRPYKLPEALQSASAAKLRFDELLRLAPGDVAAIEGQAASFQVFGRAHSYRGDAKEAEKNLSRGVELLSRIALSNPQNDGIAELLNDLLSDQARVYKATGRNELAAASSEARVELTESHLDTPRRTYWLRQRLGGLQTLAGHYSDLGRLKDALVATEHQIEVLRHEYQQEPQNEKKLLSLVLALFQAGDYARQVPQGVVAFDRYQETLERSERRLAEIGLSNDRDQFSLFNFVVYASIDGLSRLTISMLPAEQRVSVFRTIVSHIERHATTEPRIITYRDAFGRALHQLAIAQEQAGNISAALAAHEHASKVGWRASTVVLRRWFLEGHTAVEVDLTRAQQLEALASHQQEIAWWDIPTKSRSSGDVSTETVYLEEPESNALPIADEIFRLRRFQDVEITREGEQLIKRIYDLAQTNKESVAGLLERSRRERSSQMLRTSVSDAIDASQKLLKDGKLEDAYQSLAQARDSLKHSPGIDGAQADVLAWGFLAEMFDAVVRTAKEKQNEQIDASAQADEKAALDQVLKANADGSSPRLRLAGELELLARRAKDAKRSIASIALYERANRFRKLVRVDDPKNANCACSMATNLDFLSLLYAVTGAEDDALRAKLAAVQIYEDLTLLAPEANWEDLLAKGALELAELYAARREPKSARLYALRASAIRASAAKDHSADSKIRLSHGAALESVSRYSYATALLLPRTEKDVAARLYQQAIDSLQQANSIRESVLAVDPANGECRCQVDSNLRVIGSYYKELGQRDVWLSSLLKEIGVRRNQVRENPENYAWRANLASLLTTAVRSLPGEDADPRAIPLYREAAEEREKIAIYYRSLLAKSNVDRDKFKELHHGNLVNLSFVALFARRDRIALAAAEEALVLKPTDLVPATNVAHALMYLGRIQEARKFYIENKGKRIGANLWEEEVLNDFKQLAQAGRKHQLMDEITSRLAVKQ